jgi:hypothetical protein
MVLMNRVGMVLLVEAAVHPVGRGEVTLPGGRAGAGVPAVVVVVAGTAKQGQCLGFMCSVYLGCSRRVTYVGTCIDSGLVAIIPETISTSPDSAIKSTLVTLKRPSPKLAG